MNESSIANISLFQLGLSFTLVIPVLIILYRWHLGAGNAVYALARMLAQLLIVGYLLAFIFSEHNVLIICVVITVMIISASWIALGPVHQHRRNLYGPAMIAIVVPGVLSLFIITQGVLSLNPWYEPRYLIPLAGMVFANAMNSVSLAAERIQAEISRTSHYLEARTIAFQASIIPTINSLFAVGLVSLPGMMTGQILSGISPLIAARYQIVIMCMVFGSAGLASALFLTLSRRHYKKDVFK